MPPLGGSGGMPPRNIKIGAPRLILEGPQLTDVDFDGILDIKKIDIFHFNCLLLFLSCIYMSFWLGNFLKGKK